MQITETVSEGLKREYRVVVPVADLALQVGERLNELKNRVRLNGFRPGKVPVDHLKRLYGRAVMAEAIEAAVQSANTQIVTDRGFKLASEPKVTMPTEEQQVEAMIAGKADLSYTVELEVVPAISLADFKDIKLEKMVADVSDKEVEEAIERISQENRPFIPKGDGTKAEVGDRLTINFTGKIDGTPFEGGTGEDIAVLIGSGSFIPGFEEQVIGMAPGDTRTVTAAFPVNYTNQHLAGKEAEFAVEAKALDTPGEASVDDEFAKTLGMESLDKLKEAVRERLKREHETVSRQRMKRALLDELDKRHKFDPPPSMVEEEFDNVWKTVQEDLQSRQRTFEDEGTTEEAARKEYREIAERRVRLGLVIAEIGEKNNITVTDEELTRTVVERSRQFPGQEQTVFDFYRNNPNAVASLRAPIFEDKVVDFLFELANVTEKSVPSEELMRLDDEDEEAPPAAG